MNKSIFVLMIVGIISAAAATILPGLTSDSVNSVMAQGQNMTEAKFLFIQGAQSGSISEINATASTLELSDASDKTILFSDRPHRIVSAANTTDFIGNWSTGPDSFAINPPNAVLILDDEVQRHLAVIKLHNPEYDSEANTLKYDISAVNATTPIGLPGEFGQSTLVIDSDSKPYLPTPPLIYGEVTFDINRLK